MAFLMIDNYDSFTFNLVQYFWELGVEMDVVRNDQVDSSWILARNYEGIVLSPGPGSPKDSGICREVVSNLSSDTPVFGVCLGHQVIGEVFGGRVDRAPRLMHGKTSPIIHSGEGLFSNLPVPFDATRYHSLVILPETMPKELVVTAWTEEGEIMGVRHVDRPVWGVQFHPESILTKEGKSLLGNFLRLSKSFQSGKLCHGK
ncbi:anthranilate synthase component II [Leptospirillum ferrooxidans]|jgi:anthranilate synthase/aminodeoxychorismate synthase-like glutamine amidotransferase|uniref:Putative anthranilate synthase component II n=1 Tax=Leptospirillum ferrooxidans (strain C2-3) TaxID=1162668 RepID=I0IMA0_LEPFC|nr:aminodeoxychorismate/anthranilate synthase component II [Leptospirillum ferrooxidans]BAM06399.1 putative anthranilate synthase component II [Leptospirillum ferrooxidans C2-3]